MYKQSINDKVYSLSEIPLEHATYLELAIRDIEPRVFLNMVGSKWKYSRNSMRVVLERAMAQNAIHSVKGRLCDGKIETFVNRCTFPSEFSAFIEKVINGQATLSKGGFRCILQSSRRRRRTYTHQALRKVYSNPILLHIVELFCQDLDAFIKLAELSRFSPYQIHGEISGLMGMVAQRRPKTVLEIGTNKGGSLYLFTKVADPTARLATIDLRIKNKKLLGSFERKRQRITLIEGDSTARETIARTRDIFLYGLDFLFIDGDHSYEGVEKDFENYSPLVRPGGCVAFHDIVEDNHTRYGVRTAGWSGGVPSFWREVKQRFKHIEFIENPDQDGLGIGVLFMPEVGCRSTGRESE